MRAFSTSLPLLVSALLAGPAAASTFEPYISSLTGSWADAVAIGDVNGDGLKDVVLTTTFYFDSDRDYCVFVYLQRPDGSLAAPVKMSYQSTASRTGLKVADLDKDGIDDIIVGHGTGITIFQGQRWEGFVRRVLPGNGPADDIAILDVNHDGNLDVIGQGWSGSATVYYGDGHAGVSGTGVILTSAQGYNDIETGDLNADGLDDLVVLSGQGWGGAEVLLNNGVNGFFPSQTYFGVGQTNISALAIGDLDTDGRNELIFGKPTNSPTFMWIYRQGTGGGLTGPSAISTYDIPEVAQAEDINSDGRDDLMVLHGGWGAMSLYRQDVSGLQSEVLFPVSYASHYNSQGMDVGDINGDGCKDVAIADYNSGLGLLRGMGCLVLPSADLHSSLSFDGQVMYFDINNPDLITPAYRPVMRIRLAPRGMQMTVVSIPEQCVRMDQALGYWDYDCQLPTLAAGASLRLDFEVRYKPRPTQSLRVRSALLTETNDLNHVNSSTDVNYQLWTRHLTGASIPTASAPTPWAEDQEGAKFRPLIVSPKPLRLADGKPATKRSTQPPIGYVPCKATPSDKRLLIGGAAAAKPAVNYCLPSALRPASDTVREAQVIDAPRNAGSDKRSLVKPAVEDRSVARHAAVPISAH